MKHLIILFLLPLFSNGQTCDTLYSHENYVQRAIEIEYRNCHYIQIDSTYTIVQWTNIDTNYLKPFYSENICYSLFHSITGNLIRERWKVDDTTFVKSYYSSGKIKRFSKHFLRKDPMYFHDKIIDYYENGNIRYEGEYKSLSFSTHKSYYPNGAIESLAKRFSYNPDAFGDYTEYFPNGQPSMILTYFEPDTTTDQYQSAKLFAEKYFDSSGNEVAEDLNKYKRMQISIYPPVENSEFFFTDENLYTYENFSDQEAYSNEMQALKSKIRSNLKIDAEGDCTKGIVWFSLFVRQNGDVELNEVEFENEEVRKRVRKSIKKIKHWPAGVLDDEKVDAYVYTYLILN